MSLVALTAWAESANPAGAVCAGRVVPAAVKEDEQQTMAHTALAVSGRPQKGMVFGAGEASVSQRCGHSESITADLQKKQGRYAKPLEYQNGAYEQ
jgi:hypothetical protein